MKRLFVGVLALVAAVGLIAVTQHDVSTGPGVAGGDVTGIAADMSTWMTTELVDARTGEAFTFADFAGKTVIVESMATWCGVCRLQMTNIRDALTQVTGEDIVVVGISTETALDPADLASYAEGNRFDWTFAVATVDLLRGLDETFGRAVTNPPATPTFLIFPDGSLSDLHAGGVKSTQQIVDLLTGDKA